MSGGKYGATLREPESFDNIESKVKGLVPEGIEGTRATTKKVANDQGEALSRNDVVGRSKIPLCEARKMANEIHWSKNQLIAKDIVPADDLTNNPLQHKKVPDWLAQKGFRIPFDVESVFDGQYGKVHYCLTGPKTPFEDSGLLMCFHGINGNREIFERTHDWITTKGDHYVLSLDLYGHGLSENVRHHASKKTYSLEFFAKQVEELLDHLHLRKYPRSLCGFSMGALVAAAVANREPELVERVILISPAFFIRKPSVVGCVRGCQCLIKCVNPCCVSRLWFRKNHYDDSTVAQGRQADSVTFNRRAALQLVVKGNVVDAFLGCVAQLPMWNAKELLTELGKHNLPTLLLWGSRDNVADISRCLDVQDLLPNSHLIVFSKTAHLVPAEKEVETVTTILSFMTIPRSADMKEWRFVLPVNPRGLYVKKAKRHPPAFDDVAQFRKHLEYNPRYTVSLPEDDSDRQKTSDPPKGEDTKVVEKNGSTTAAARRSSDEEGVIVIVKEEGIFVKTPSMVESIAASEPHSTTDPREGAVAKCQD